MVTRSIEDYLKNIYQLQAEDKVVNTTILANTIHVSPASVSEMVSKLSKLGYIKNNPYKGFKLTKTGEKIAVNLVRKHRLIEVFLHDHLNYPWDEVHNDAELIEHVCSENFIDRLDKFLGYPDQDPHGGPIPDKNGNTKTVRTFLLPDAKQGADYFVSMVNDKSNEFLKYISTIGIKLKTKIKLVEKLKFDNSLLIKVGNKNHLISSKIAENISVSELAE